MENWNEEIEWEKEFVNNISMSSSDDHFYQWTDKCQIPNRSNNSRVLIDFCGDACKKE